MNNLPSTMSPVQLSGLSLSLIAALFFTHSTKSIEGQTGEERRLNKGLQTGVLTSVNDKPAWYSSIFFDNSIRQWIFFRRINSIELNTLNKGSFISVAVWAACKVDTAASRMRIWDVRASEAHETPRHLPANPIQNPFLRRDPETSTKKFIR